VSGTPAGGVIAPRHRIIPHPARAIQPVEPEDLFDHATFADFFK
jgi:hypothetical protein